jgi:4-hydroxy-tetrahydrodipicolinate synthase
MPAITTPLAEDLTINHGELADHVRRMADAGCTAIVTPGSLGEAGTLTLREREQLWNTCVQALEGRIPSRLRWRDVGA